MLFWILSQAMLDCGTGSVTLEALEEAVEEFSTASPQARVCFLCVCVHACVCARMCLCTHVLHGIPAGACVLLMCLCSHVFVHACVCSRMYSAASPQARVCASYVFVHACTCVFGGYVVGVVVVGVGVGVGVRVLLCLPCAHVCVNVHCHLTHC